MQGYPHFHKNRTNLLLHIVMVPLFVVGVVYSLSSAMQGRWLAASLALSLPLVSIAIQGAVLALSCHRSTSAAGPFV